MTKANQPRERTRSMSSRSPEQGFQYYSYKGTTSIATDYGIYPGYGQDGTMTDIVGNPPRPDLGLAGFSYNPMRSIKNVHGGTTNGFWVRLKENGANWYSGGVILPQLRSSLGLPSGDSNMRLATQTTLDQLQYAAATGCLAKRGKGNVNNYENIFQMQSTIDELRHPLKNFALWSDRWVDRFEAKYHKIHGARKVRVKTGVDLPLDLYASAWLQYRYGVRLLINDVEQVLKDVEKISDRRQLVTERDLKKVSESYRSNLIRRNHGVTSWDSSYTIDETITCRATSHDEYILDALQQVGLSGKNLLTVGWERIPYSFVADWFFNIGDFLAASVPTPNIHHLGECLSTKRVTTLLCQTSFAGINNNAYEGTGSSGTHSVITTEYSRGNSLGTPRITVQPDFKLLTLTRAADAAALAFGALNRAFGSSGRIRLLNH